MSCRYVFALSAAMLCLSAMASLSHSKSANATQETGSITEGTRRTPSGIAIHYLQSGRLKPRGRSSYSGVTRIV
jgi:hypothetical protein